MPSGLVELLTWDTAFWGVRAARLHVSNGDEFDAADRACADDNIRWASVLVPHSNAPLLNSAVRRGFDVVDTRITLVRSLVDLSVRTLFDLAGVGDIAQISEIAATAFRVSRFFVDPHLDDSACELFYETWVRNSFNGEMADATVVSRHDGSVDGFMTLRSRPDHTASLPLVATRSDRRGQGVGRRLLSDALSWLADQGATTVDVVTQLSNIAAVRLYESAGFQITDAGFWLHRWY